MPTRAPTANNGAWRTRQAREGEPDEGQQPDDRESAEPARSEAATRTHRRRRGRACRRQLSGFEPPVLLDDRRQAGHLVDLDPATAAAGHQYGFTKQTAAHAEPIRSSLPTSRRDSSTGIRRPRDEPVHRPPATARANVANPPSTPPWVFAHSQITGISHASRTIGCGRSRRPSRYTKNTAMPRSWPGAGGRGSARHAAAIRATRQRRDGRVQPGTA